MPPRTTLPEIMTEVSDILSSLESDGRPAVSVKTVLQFTVGESAKAPPVKVN